MVRHRLLELIALAGAGIMLTLGTGSGYAQVLAPDVSMRIRQFEENKMRLNCRRGL